MNYNPTPLRFIAEIGSNHNQDFGRIYSLIVRAKELGCWAVKFQYYKAEKLYAPGFIPDGLKETELSLDMVKKINNICNDIGIVFGCSVFDADDVPVISTYVDYIKIASYEILKLDLIEAAAESGVPVHISTGLADRREIIQAIDAASEANKIVIYHCCAEYPAKPEEIDFEKMKGISVLSSLHYEQDFSIGYSDHSVNTSIVCTAVALGAEYIEFHLDLDGAGDEYKHRHCWLPQQADFMIKSAIQVKQALQPAKIKPNSDRFNRADPEDGMRPHKEMR